MQLMKLVYIAHGWSLALLDRDLFSDRIEAWKYGPVIPNLYHATKAFGRNVIPQDLVDDSAASAVDDDIQAFLEDVVAKYGHLNGIQLSNLTHMPNTPWHDTYEANIMGKEIPDPLIRSHYQAKLDEHRQSSSAAA
jgi:uncharacterized phage-associated protein